MYEIIGIYTNQQEEICSSDILLLLVEILMGILLLQRLRDKYSIIHHTVLVRNSNNR